MVAVTICNILQFSRKTYRLSLFCQSADHTGMDDTAAYQMREDIAVIKEQVGQIRTRVCRQDQDIREDMHAMQEQLAKQLELINDNTRLIHDLTLEITKLKTEGKTLKYILGGMISTVIALAGALAAWWRGG